MASRTTWTIKDYTDENSAFGVFGLDVNAGNYAAQLALWDAFEAALMNIVIGNVAERKWLAQLTNPTPGLPANQYAQREFKWLVRYGDAVGNGRYQTEIATPDLSLLTPNTDFMNLSAGAGAAFVTAFENAVTNEGGAAINVINAELVGRNL